MLSREDNDLVTRVGAGAPAGEMFRRYWLPVCDADEIGANDSAPLRVRLLGEDLIAFRDTNGKVGVLEEMCMHRGASLALGRVEDCGVRCLYHGWKFGVDGALQETPNHSDPRYRAMMRQPAYPAREAGGVVWAYLGPKEKEPPFPVHRFMNAAPANRCVIRVNVNANYLQLWEGGCDSSHVGILHSDMARPGWLDKTFKPDTDPLNPGAFASDDNAPRLEIEDTAFGYHYAAYRKMPEKDGVAQENIRIVPIMMPCIRIIPAPNSWYTVFEVPADDENTNTFIIVDSDRPVDVARVHTILGLDDRRFYDPATRDFTAVPKQRWGQDRPRMAQNWGGLRGIEIEDAIISLSMGPVMKRWKEHLVAADQAVVRLRRRILTSIRQVQEGGDPLGLDIDFARILAGDWTLPAGAKWQEIAAVNRTLERPRQLAAAK